MKKYAYSIVLAFLFALSQTAGFCEFKPEYDVIDYTPTGSEKAVVTRNIPSGTQPVSGSLSVPALTSLVTGNKSVTTAGSRVALASSTAVISVTVQALCSNQGIIYVGNSSVSASNGFPLYAGASVSLDLSNLNLVYIDSSVNGEGVSFICIA